MQERNRWIAILLAIFAGVFGIHKFYLGENRAGVFYLLLCWSGITAILTFFDCIWLLLVSDKEFNRRFNFELPEDSKQPRRNSQEVTDTLANLKRLYEEGVITAGEYEEKRQNLLKDL